MNILVKNYHKLANAIVIQGAKDYEKALRGVGKHPEWTVEECEMFFKSDWFKLLTKLDGKMILRKIKREVLNDSKTRSKHSYAHRDNI